MYFNTSVLSAILMGSALVAAIPRGIVERAPVSEVNVVFSRDLSMAEDMQPNNDFAEEAFKKCGELGIDPYGDMPTDYFKTDGKSYHFKEDSKGVLWIAAQSSLSFDAGKIRRRELTGYSFAYVSRIYLVEIGLES
jgi:hypothetical protein